MAYIEWTKDLSVGVKQFNDDHKQLVQYVNELHSGIVSNLGISQMSYIMDGLISYTVRHFKNEEKYMVKFSYPGYEDHKKAHDILIAKVQQYKNRLDDGETSFSLELMGFLKKWLVEHIQISDMKYKEFFKQHGKPGKTT